jgi:acid phosphatase
VRSSSPAHIASASTDRVSSGSKHPRARRTPSAGFAPTKILAVVLENHAQAQALSSMPYLSSLARRFGRTRNYRAITHPSLPNYLALVAGSTFGIHDDNQPSSHRLRGGSIFDQALARGLTAKVYAESMPHNCALVATGSYAVKHNPWTYFAGRRQRSNCRRHDVPMGTPTGGALAHDVRAGTLPRVGLAIPNICHDAHDCSLGTADHWLHRWLAKILTGPDYRAGRLAVVVTFDENDGVTPNTVLTVAISPRTRHVQANAAYSHYSWLRCADTMLGLPPLRKASSARSLCTAFKL